MTIMRAERRNTMRLGALAAGAVALALLVPASQAASAHTSARIAAADAGVKPSIVLVHGAWGDSANWDGVVRRLQQDGYTVYVPPNPLEGLTYDAASIRDFLDTISGPIILVGHSYGGAVITNAATGDPNVKALVYDDAFIPAQGQTIGQLVSAVPGSCAGGPNLVLVPYPGEARITIIPGAPHLSMITDPGIVTQVILDAVHATT
jgi:pimeloyl-ACP methyl ester carboxylesterase